MMLLTIWFSVQLVLQEAGVKLVDAYWSIPA